MARTLSEIYNAAVAVKNERMELRGVSNGSTMSVMNAFIWVVSACIWSFENLFDVLQADLLLDLRDRINGTPAYYTNILLRYQHGDELVPNAEGTRFSYAKDDPSKRVISKVAFTEAKEARHYDRLLMFKVAKDNPDGRGGFVPLSQGELAGARAYMRQVAFAGTHFHISSRRGDILIPRLTVYHDGSLTEAVLLQKVRAALTQYIKGLRFNASVYVQEIYAAIKAVPQVLDVYAADQTQGVFVVQYDNDNLPIRVAGVGDRTYGYEDFIHTLPAAAPSDYERRVDRVFNMKSGFMKEADKGEGFDMWGDALRFVVESTPVDDDEACRCGC